MSRESRSASRKTDTSDDTSHRHHQPYLLLLLLLGISLVSFAGGPPVSEFVYDDETLMSTPDVLGTNPVTDLWYHDFWGMPLTHVNSHKSHRPLTVLFLRCVHAAFGKSPYAFRAASSALHALVSFLVYVVAKWTSSSSTSSSFLSSSPSLSSSVANDRAIWASILFASHPVHGDVVFQVVGCAESLCALLLLVSFALFVSGRPRAALLFAPGLAMFAKEQGVLATIVLFAYAVLVAAIRFVREEFDASSVGSASPASASISTSSFAATLARFRQAATSLLCTSRSLLVATVIVAAVKFFFLVGEMPHYDALQNPAAHASSPVVRALSHHYAVGRHFQLLVWPKDLSVDWSAGSYELVESVLDLRLALPLALYALLVAILFRLFRHNDDDLDTTYVAAGWILLVVPFLPASNLLFPVGFVLAERVLYTPSVGFCMLLAEGIRRAVHETAVVVKKKERDRLVRYGTTLVVLAVAAAYVARNVVRASDFVSKASVFEAALVVTPRSVKVQQFVANARRDAGDLESAEALLLSALRAAPFHVESLNNLASLYVDVGRVDEAEKLLRRAVDEKPGYAVASDNLAILLSGANGLPTTQRRLEEARETLAASIERASWRDVCDLILQTEGCFRWQEQHRLMRYIDAKLGAVGGEGASSESKARRIGGDGGPRGARAGLGWAGA